MYCTRCGAELPDGVRFCTACGSPVESNDPVEAAGAAPSNQNNPVSQPTMAEQPTVPSQVVQNNAPGYSQAQAAAPAGASAGAPVGTAAAAKPRGAKGKTIGIIIAVLVVLLAAGVAAYYFLFPRTETVWVVDTFTFQSEKSSNATEYTYDYNEDGLVSSTTVAIYSTGDESNKDVLYTSNLEYDDNGRLVKSTATYETDATATIAYEYDSNDCISRYANFNDDGTGIVLDVTCNEQGYITSCTQTEYSSGTVDEPGEVSEVSEFTVEYEGDDPADPTAMIITKNGSSSSPVDRVIPSQALSDAVYDENGNLESAIAQGTSTSNGTTTYFDVYYTYTYKQIEVDARTWKPNKDVKLVADDTDTSNYDTAYEKRAAFSRSMNYIRTSFLSTDLSEEDSDSSSSDTDETTSTDSESSSTNESSVISSHTQPFWGVWVAAMKDLAGAEEVASELSSNGYDAQIFLSSEWENLNADTWYVVTAGVFDTESEAEQVMDELEASGLTTSAYVKHSGDYKG